MSATDAMVYFDNDPSASLQVSAVDQRSWSERIKQIKTETCQVCGCKLRNKVDALCRDCAVDLLRDCEQDDTDN
jgi:hypothetical protein